MAYKTPKTDWKASEAMNPNDVNRIEGNTLDNHERLDDIEDGTTKVPRAINADEASFLLYQPGQRVIHENNSVKDSILYKDTLEATTSRTDIYVPLLNCIVEPGTYNIEFKAKVDSSTTSASFYIALNGEPVTPEVDFSETSYFTQGVVNITVEDGSMLEVYGKMISQSGTLNTKDLFIKYRNDYATIKESQINIIGEMTVEADIRTSNSSKRGDFAYFLNGKKLAESNNITSTSFQTVSKTITINEPGVLSFKGRQDDPKAGDYLEAGNMKFKVLSKAETIR